MGGRGAAPPAAVIGRLRAAVPGTVTIDLVFDGMGHGVFGRVAQGMTVRYSGKRSADDVILDLASEAAMEAGADRRPSHVLAVTNDRELREPARGEGRPDGAAAVADWDASTCRRSPPAAPGNRRPPSIGAGRGGPRAARTTRTSGPAGSPAAARPRRPARRARSRATSATRATAADAPVADRAGVRGGLLGCAP